MYVSYYFSPASRTYLKSVSFSIITYFFVLKNGQPMVGRCGSRRLGSARPARRPTHGGATFGGAMVEVELSGTSEPAASLPRHLLPNNGN